MTKTGVRIRKKSLNNKVAYGFILPAFIIHFCLVALPSVSTLMMALYDWNGLGGGSYIGLANFREIFTADSVVRIAVKNNLIWLSIFLIVPIFLGLLVSFLLSRIKLGQQFLRTIYFVPYVISAAVAGRIWTAYFNPFYGINQLFDAMGLSGLADTLWLGNPRIALFSIAFVDNWHWWGYIMVLFLGALQQVDPALYESARVDGASKFEEFAHISIPSIMPTIRFVLIMTVIWSFLTFDYVYVMTNGGPANSTEIMSTWIYKNAFSKYRAGYASALCVIQSGICLVFYFLQRYLNRRGYAENEA